MLRRSSQTYELLKDRNAFMLLTAIALRARRTAGFNIHDLKPGQALIGDYQSYGLSKQEYRSAKQRLARWGLVDFQATPRGTVATLLDKRVYDINEIPEQHPNNTQPARTPHSANTQPTTNNNDKNENNDKKTTPNADALRLATLLFDLIRQGKGDFRRPNLERWTRDIDRLIRLDRRDPERIEAVLRFCQSDSFWRSNILSPAALRKHFDRLELKMQQRPTKESTREMIARMEREGKL